jgi:hypothetical protein
MPSKSKKQHKFMSAVANNPKFAKKVGVPTSVGKEFTGTKAYNKGGFMAQGYDDRLDEAMGARNGVKSQDMKARRDESEGIERAMGGRKFAGDRSMDKPMGMKAGGKVRGAGKAIKGVRPCKMVTMKGA